ncbi:arsinothricin resistance N-acetyltransferase ArsN1 family B [Antribacter gilvus]|uniref:arsinothricin resistance N-acetyltransferase ArsN1 family B n=1 Tax=Antribacter gilvus TaxID=2304675 RepID=UPI000F7B193F|nr:arsinothricin resistance N-acetyltransferase ArsN1 family B [Antribacter gilvus]
MDLTHVLREDSDGPRPGAAISLTIRDATVEDAPACAAIYAPFVRDTWVSFESEPPDADEMAHRIETYQQRHAWLVAELDGRVVGYAYATPYAARAAYRWSVETSVYLAPDARGQGAGRRLYEALFTRLRRRGYRRIVTGVALPNDASVRLHESLGFRQVGTFERIGWKLGGWRDVTRFQLDLVEEDTVPDGGAAGPGGPVTPAEPS